jgi:hypothetical protein
VKRQHHVHPTHLRELLTPAQEADAQRWDAAEARADRALRRGRVIDVTLAAPAPRAPRWAAPLGLAIAICGTLAVTAWPLF